jgi:hypothetical protein
MNERQIVTKQTYWDNDRQCWLSVVVYWEKGFIFDTEWTSNDCYITRVEYIMWREAQCFNPEKNRATGERKREIMRAYVLAENFCKNGFYKAWTENSESEPGYKEKYDNELDMWVEDKKE